MIKGRGQSMDESEVITSEGKGVWGARYELRLLTSVRTYSDSVRQANKTVQRYVVEFGPKSQADRRLFVSDDARRAFLEQSFSDLVLTEIPESKRDTTRLFLRGDAELPYKNVLDLMNELKTGGFYKISLVGHEAVK